MSTSSEEVQAGVEAAFRARHRKTVRVSTILSTIMSTLGICVIILPVFGYFLSPWFFTMISTAMAGEIKTEVQSQVAPINAGFKVLIQSRIAELEDEVSKLEYVRDNNRGNWTPVMNMDLTTKKRRLGEQRKALQALENAEKA